MEEVKTDNSIEKKKEPMTTKQKVIFGLKIAGNVVFYAIIIALFLFSLMNIRGGNGRESFPNLFGNGMLTVASNSMSHKDANGNEKKDLWTADGAKGRYNVSGFTTSDLLYVKVFKESDANSLVVGDVITFFDSSLEFNKTGQKGALNTHRIVYVGKNAEGNVDFVVTEGDAQYYLQPYNTADTEEARQYNYRLEASGVTQNVTLTNIKGVVTGVGYGSGGFLTNIQQNWLWYFVVPVIIVLAVEIFLVIRNILIYRDEKNGGKKAKLTEEEKAKILEEEKAKLREELLAELRKEQAQAVQEEEIPAVKEEEAIVEDAKPETQEDVATEAIETEVSEGTKDEE